MLGRALSFAAVTLLIGCFAASPVRAQNLEAGKSPSQIFAGTCNACHKSPRGLLKTVSPGSLPGFLREHYTTSSEMASLLSSYLVSNGANDGRGAKSGGGSDADRQGRRMRSGSQEAVRPESDGQPGESGRQSRRRLSRPVEGPDDARPAADDDRKPTAKQRLGKRGRPGSEELPRTDSGKSDVSKPDSDAAVGKDEPPRADDKPSGAAAREEGSKPEAAKVEGPRESGSAAPAVRADPVPAVTPAPSANSTAASGGAAEQPAVRPSAPQRPAEPASPPATASTPPAAAPGAHAGSPAPPISQ
jgi:hypothetical protein